MKRSLYLTGLILIPLFIFLYYSSRSEIYQGDQTLYSYSSEGVGYSDMDKLYSQDTNASSSFFRSKTLQRTDFKIKCQVKKTVIKKGEEKEELGFQITNPELTIQNNDLSINTALIEDELSRPFFAELTPAGKLTTIRIDSSVSYLAANTMKGIISQLQFVKENHAPNSWETEEENTLGTYRARYHFIKDSNGLSEYLKENAGYVRIRSGQNKQKILVESRSRIYLDSAEIIQRMDVSEAQFVLFGADTITASGSKTDIQLLSKNTAAESELASLDELLQTSNYSEVTTLSAGLSTERIHQLAYRNTLGNDSWETLIQKLEAASEEDNKTKEQLILQFRALVYLQPETCEKIKNILVSEPYGTRRFAILSQALSYAETEQSVNTIVQIIDYRKNEENVVLELLPVLAMSKLPTSEAIEVTKKLAFDQDNNPTIRSTAQLTLAGLAYNFRRLDSNASARLTKYILSKLNQETDTIQKILVLGNTGSPAIVPILNSYIFSQTASMQVKTYAVGGFKLINDTSITEVLKTLSVSKEEPLREAAKATMAFRKEYFEKQKP